MSGVSYTSSPSGFLLAALGLSPAQARETGYALIAAADAVDRAGAYHPPNSPSTPSHVNPSLVRRGYLRIGLAASWPDNIQPASSSDGSSSETESFVSLSSSPLPSPTLASTLIPRIHSSSARPTTSADGSSSSPVSGPVARSRSNFNSTPNSVRPLPSSTPSTSNSVTGSISSPPRGSARSHRDHPVIPPMPRNARVVPRGYVYPYPDLNTTGTVYVVTRGVRVGVFADWSEAGPYVTNISGSLHKGVTGVSYAMSLLDTAIHEQWACWI
ncbi:hypothetical protein ONZ45_g12675 [Pleurotus djamor]|nr:hypothetical protein ONZ45_g12675 [Pleurotus djamor]